MTLFYHLIFLMIAATTPTGMTVQATENEPVPKVNIPDLPPSFRDVGIDLRCSALSEYIGRYAQDYLNELGYKEIGCSEGNGLGGATYELEFKLKNVADVKAYSIQISMNDNNRPNTKICMQTEHETYCSLGFNTIPPNASHFKVDLDEKATAFINRNYVQPAKQLSQLMPTVALWVAGDQKFKRIFGKDFNVFVGSMLNKSLAVPVSVSQKTTTLKIELTPASKVSTSSGVAKLLSDLPPELQGCLGCKDSQCKQTRLNYSFNNRFLSISGTPENQDRSKVQDKEHGLAWIMDGPDPILKDEPLWRFFCGVSRYSVQVIKQ